MQINHHLLSPADQVLSPNRSGVIDPSFIVMHYTAGWTAESAISWLCNPKAQASAHVVIDNDGRVTQLVPFNIKAWHAGPSSYAGHSGMNSYSVGIEIVNPGFLKRVGSDRFMDSRGDIHRMGEGLLARRTLVPAKHPRVGGDTYFWPAYTKAQLDAVEALTSALIETYEIIDIASHEEIDRRGWKTDPGPAFPMTRFKSLLQHRGTDLDRYVVTASRLNARRGPGAQYDVTGTLARGETVTKQDQRDEWVRISDDLWVHGAYLRRA